jgi:FixJ family two-component response regulator
MIEADEGISIIVTDLKMPGQDGLTMVQELRDRYVNTRDLAVIVITGNAGTDEAIKALRLGAIDFITKPISPDHLLHAVGRAAETLQLRLFQKQFHEHLEYKVEERTQEARLLLDDLSSANQKLQSLNLELSLQIASSQNCSV